MVSVEGLLGSIAIAILGYVAGTLKPIVGQDYHTDRIWCQKTKEIYEDIETQLEEIEPLEEDHVRGDGSIEKVVKELEDHTEDYPNFRREERNKAKEIADNVLDVFPDPQTTGVYTLGGEPPNLREDHEEARKTEAEIFKQNRKEILTEIEKTQEELSYGLLLFGKSIICGQRKI